MINISKKRLHVFFEASALLKAIGSLAEIALGVLFLTLSPQTVNKVIFFIFGDELTEVPRDPIWVFLLHGFTGISASIQHFWAFIFIAHGAAIMLLVVGLVKKKLSMYPLTALIFACLLVYQIFHVIFAPSLLLSFLSTFDAFFIWLIIQEYQYQKMTKGDFIHDA